jgi:hypothetical protein
MRLPRIFQSCLALAVTFNGFPYPEDVVLVVFADGEVNHIYCEYLNFVLVFSGDFSISSFLWHG